MGVNGNWGSCSLLRSMSSGYWSSGPESRGNLRERYGFNVSVGQGSNNDYGLVFIIYSTRHHRRFQSDDSIHYRQRFYEDLVGPVRLVQEYEIMFWGSIFWQIMISTEILDWSTNFLPYAEYWTGFSIHNLKQKEGISLYHIRIYPSEYLFA